MLMKPALVSQKPEYPQSWADLPMGEHIQQIIESSLLGYSRQMFGYHLVRVGNLSSGILLPECPIKHKVNLSASLHNHSNLVAKSKHLPLLENSVDAFVLANELDFTRDPHQVLREINRAIIPNGHLIITGFNPFGLAGISRFMPFTNNRALRQARFFSRPRVKDWLSLLGFEIVEQEYRIFSELLVSRNISETGRGAKLRALGEKYLPHLSAIYIVVARKRVVPLSLTKAKWRPKPKFAAVGANMRQSQAARTSASETDVIAKG